MQSGLIKLENLLVIRDLQRERERERVLRIAPGWRFNFREAISVISGVHCNELNIDTTNIGTFGGEFKKTGKKSGAACTAPPDFSSPYGVPSTRRMEAA